MLKKLSSLFYLLVCMSFFFLIVFCSTQKDVTDMNDKNTYSEEVAVEKTLDLNKPEDALKALLKVRASLNLGEEVVYWWTGNIYSYVSEEKSKLLFKMEGYNIGKIVESEKGYNFLSREVALYKDPKTGEILEKWENPFTKKTVDVVHVWNDPVNQQWGTETPWGPFRLSYTDMEETTVVYFDINVMYPNPLPKDEYPLYSQSNTYKSTELFNFFVDTENLHNPNMKSIPANISWTRIGPWLPWMQMGDKSGNIYYQCRGKKLENGYEDLPDYVKDYVEENHQEFTSAPDEFEEQNETTWTYFKKLLESGEYEPAD